MKLYCSRVDESLVDRIALGETVFAIHNYRKRRAKFADLSEPHSVAVAQPRSLNSECMNRANWLADIFEANGKYHSVMMNVMLNVVMDNTDENAGVEMV